MMQMNETCNPIKLIQKSNQIKRLIEKLIFELLGYLKKNDYLYVSKIT